MKQITLNIIKIVPGDDLPTGEVLAWNDEREMTGKLLIQEWNKGVMCEGARYSIIETDMFDNVYLYNVTHYAELPDYETIKQ